MRGDGTGKNNTGAKGSSHRPQGPQGRKKTLETKLEMQSQKMLNVLFRANLVPRTLSEEERGPWERPGDGRLLLLSSLP